jgi:hypothetical protein
MTGLLGSGPEGHPARSCPGCGTRIPDARTGRRRVYCGEACRKAAFRKRKAARAAIRQARRLPGQIIAAWREVQGEMASLGNAVQRMMQAQTGAGGDQEDRDDLLERGHGWELVVHDAASGVEGRAARIAEMALEYGLAVDQYRAVRSELSHQPVTMDVAASGSAARLGTSGALLAAASDVVSLTRPGRARPLPARLAAALARPAATLAAEVERQDGTRPVSELEADAAAVLAAAHPFSREIPTVLAMALARLAETLPGGTAS